MTEEIDVQRLRDEFLEFLEELTEQFEELPIDAKAVATKPQA